ncbi:L-lactate permease [Natroniella sulfidigena]|nr:L-lactate permease [Natroniella sulfidigena]MCK8817519.1 L-lactate permease [Natroniella sulfidigena]
MEFNIYLWLSAIIPIFLLLFTISYLKIDSTRAALSSLISALLIGVLIYEFTIGQLMISMAKGASLSIYVILILVGAIIFYNTIKVAGAFDTIKDFILSYSGDELVQILAFSWAFASFIQGISGFGVPVVIMASLLVAMGFKPVIALSAVLIGYSWSLGFGSMGSAFYGLSLVTGLEPIALGVVSTVLFYIPIITTGLAVTHFYGGIEAAKRGLKYILPIGLLMGSAQLGAAKFGFAHLATLLGGLAGSLAFFILFKGNKRIGDLKQKESRDMGINLALLPYFVLIVAVFIPELPVIKELVPDWELGFSYPGFTTSLGYEVAAEETYAAIDLFSHPFAFLILASIIGGMIYLAKGHLDSSKVNTIFKDSYKQASTSSIAVLFLMVMALVMNDSGMLYIFAEGMIKVSGEYFPLISPFIGTLGAFLTGSTTSSNVLFGGGQVVVAELLETSPYLIASSQSVGASLGSAIAPAKILIGVSVVGSLGTEGEILKKTLGYTLLSTLVVGIAVYAIALLI